MKPSNFNVWNKLEAQLKWMRWIVLSMVFCGGMLALFLLKAWNQRVVVISVEEDGKASTSWNRPTVKTASEREVISFTEEFLHLYLAPTSDKVEANFKRATAMMSAALRKRHRDFSSQTEYVERIRKMKVSTELSLKSIVVERSAKGIFSVYASGQQRTLQVRGAAVFHPFKGLVMLKPIRRSKFNPYGLQVVYLDYEIQTT